MGKIKNNSRRQTQINPEVESNIREGGTLAVFHGKLFILDEFTNQIKEYSRGVLIKEEIQDIERNFERCARSCNRVLTTIKRSGKDLENNSIKLNPKLLKLISF